MKRSVTQNQENELFHSPDTNQVQVAVEQHPLKPFLPQGARLLMLGSFPPPHNRWSMEFYYPNFNNDMWRIFGLLFFDDRRHFELEGAKAFDYKRVVDFCTLRGLAIYDTATSVRRLMSNASDKYLEVVERTDVLALIESLPDCVAVAVTGEKAAQTIAQELSVDTPAVGQCSRGVVAGREMELWRMPSSSRAYPMALEQKAARYSLMLHQVGMLP